MSTHTITPTDLPTTIRAYLDAHADRATDDALAHFTEDAVVTDQGQTFRGTDEVRTFLDSAGAEFTYTSELVGAERADDGTWVAVVRIEGDFPGAVAQLRYRFVLRDGQIAELAITG